MGKTVAFVNAWTSGEIAPDAWERSDLQQHTKGCAEALNLLPLVTGPLASRGGFQDRGQAQSNTLRARIVAFARSPDDALFIELGDATARIWTPAGSMIMDGGAPYVFATPWESSRLNRLWFKQIGDVLFVTDLDGEPTRVIKRLSDTDWQIERLDFRSGPWLAENGDPDITVTASDTTGDIALTASAAVFVATDVGSQMRLRENDGNPGYETWTSATEYEASAYVQFDGKVYQRSSGGTAKSGTTPPVHSSGTVSDGKLTWTFRHDGAGVVTILDYNSPTSVDARCIGRLPTSEATRYWSKRAYSETDGYPRALAEDREERLIFAASRTQPGTVDMTRTNGFGPDYGDFKPGLGTGRVVEDDAIRLNVGGGSRVVWLMSGAALIAGCTDGEYLLSGSSLDEPMTPQGRKARKVSHFGNADVEPLMVQGPPPVILHVLRSRQVLRETRVESDQTVASRELSLLARHIFERGVAEMAWQQPENIVWLRLDDGGLAALTYHLEHGVVAATRHPLPGGFIVESLASAPTPTGGDVVMAIVRRTKGGGQRRVWRLSPRADNIFVDGALRYSGAPVTVITGLTHLAGETVAVVAGGARVPDEVVSAGGAIGLPAAATDVVVGLKMNRRFVSLSLDLEGAGSTNARTIVPTHATVILTAADALVGTDAENSAERVQSRAPADLAKPVDRRVRQRVSLGGGAGRDRRLIVETDAPFDLVMHAYRLEAEVTA